jgi:tetratricopeptide (TPR) repeat protein
MWPWDDKPFARATNRFFDDLYDLDYETCRAIVDSLGSEHPEDPMVDVLRVRIYRDLIREVDLTEGEREQQFDELKELFVPLREKAEALLERDPASPRAHLALGWEGMITGQVQVMLHDYLGANSTTKTAREHLEKVLETHPGSPDAKALLGGYLYSVDTLPKFLKLFKWIPFLPIPSGDRVEGLRLLVEAAGSGAPSSRDFTIFYAFVDAFYEGIFPRGQRNMGPFFYAFPHNSRFGISMSLMAPFEPENALMADRYWRALIGAWESRREGAGGRWYDGWDRWSISLAMRMRMVAAYQWEALGRPDMALPVYQDLTTDSLAHGRRVKGPVHLGLARTAILTGNPGLARLAAAKIIDGEKELKPWRDRAKDLRKAAEEGPGSYPLAIWKESGRHVIEALESVSDPGRDQDGSWRPSYPFPRSRLREMEQHARAKDPVLLKLLGDAYALSGLSNRALRTYEEALSLCDRPELWAVRFQIHLNRSRVLEREGDVKNALREMKRADDTIEDEDLIRYPVDARLDALERALKN